MSEAKHGAAESPKPSLRDQIRTATVGAPKIFKSRRVNFNGVDIEIREPSVDGWGEILAHAHKDGEVSFKEFLIWSVVCCSFVPGTDERVFEPEDYDVLKTQPKSGFIGEFSDIANELMSVNVETAEKNLGVTAGKGRP